MYKNDLTVSAAAAEALQFLKTWNKTPTQILFPLATVSLLISSRSCPAPQKSRKLTDRTDALSLKGKPCLDQQYFDHFLHQKSDQLIGYPC